MRSTEVIRQNSMQNSITSIDKHNKDTRSIFKHPKVQIPRGMISNNSHAKQPTIDPKRQVLNAIKWTQSINNIEINPKFIDLLTTEYSMQKLAIVSIWGPENSGKSFLIDTLLSANEGISMRVFSKLSNEGANCSIRRILTKQNNPIIFLDWKGSKQLKGQTQSNIFLFMYLISSAIIFNYNSNSWNKQNEFLDIVQKTKNKLVANEAQYSLPELYLMRRDHNPIINYKVSHIVQSIGLTQMFQPNPKTVYLHYPGTQSIQMNQISDAPVVTLDKNYLRTSFQFLDMIKNTKPKYINDNAITSNMVAILISAYSNMINKHHRILLDTCWNEVLEALAVNGYNSFVTVYTQYLQNQFKDQKPLPKYELFKKLSKVKNQSNIKLQNFTNIKGQPIFDKYKDKLKQFIKGKQQMISSINASKSNNLNTKYISETKRSIFPPNEGLKEDKIYRFVNSFKNTPMIDGKTELIVYNMRQIINNDLKKLSNKVEAPELKALSQNLKQEDLKLQTSIQNLIDQNTNLQHQLKQLKGTNSRYQIKIQQKQTNLMNAIKDNIQRDREIQQKMSEQQKLAQTQLAQLKVSKEQVLQKQRQIIGDLKQSSYQITSRIREEQAMQQNIKSRIQQRDIALKKLSKKIEEMERVSQDKNRQVERLKQILAQPEKKKTTCGCFG